MQYDLLLVGFLENDCKCMPSMLHLGDLVRTDQPFWQKAANS